MTSVAASFFASFDTAALSGGGVAAGEPATGAFGALLASGQTGETAPTIALSIDPKLPAAAMTALLASTMDLVATPAAAATVTAPPPTVPPAIATEAAPTPIAQPTDTTEVEAPAAPAVTAPVSVPTSPSDVRTTPLPTETAAASTAPAAAKPVFATATPAIASPDAVEAPRPQAVAIDAPKPPPVERPEVVAARPQPMPSIDTPAPEIQRPTAEPATPTAEPSTPPATPMTATPAAPPTIAKVVEPAKPAVVAPPQRGPQLSSLPTVAIASPEPESATPTADETVETVGPATTDRPDVPVIEQPVAPVPPMMTGDPTIAVMPVVAPPPAAFVSSAPPATPAPASTPVTASSKKPIALGASDAAETRVPTIAGAPAAMMDQRIAPVGEHSDAPSHGSDSGGAALLTTPAADRASATAPRDGAPVFALPSAPAPAAAAQPASRTDAGVITARPGQIGQELGVAIARHVSGDGATGGGDTITLRLNPVDMGRIEVKLSFDDGGTLRAVVSADNPAALDMLRRDSADLGRALTDAGVRSDTQTLRFDTRAGTGQGDGGRQPWQRDPDPRGAAMTDARTDATAEDITAAYRPLRTRGRIDMVA